MVIYFSSLTTTQYPPSSCLPSSCLRRFRAAVATAALSLDSPKCRGGAASGPSRNQPHHSVPATVPGLTSEPLLNVKRFNPNSIKTIGYRHRYPTVLRSSQPTRRQLRYLGEGDELFPEGLQTRSISGAWTWRLVCSTWRSRVVTTRPYL